MQHFLRLTPFWILGLLMIAPQCEAQVVGDQVLVANTYQSVAATAGEEAIVVLLGGVVTEPGIEFEQIPNVTQFDINISSNQLVMTLVDNTSARKPVLGPNEFDRYYVGFGANQVVAASLNGLGGLNQNASVEVLPPGFMVNATDPFNAGVPLPINLPYGGFVLSLGEGTDFRELGTTARVSFETVSVPEPTGVVLLLVGLLGLRALRRGR